MQSSGDGGFNMWDETENKWRQQDRNTFLKKPDVYESGRLWHKQKEKQVRGENNQYSDPINKIKVD